MTMRRPDPLRWLWYALGGRLPARYREWVRFDCTTRTWRLRYTSHVLVKATPFLVGGYLVLSLLPAPVWSILAALGLGLAYVLVLTLGTASEFRQNRLAQHGFPPEESSR
ncbi:hypothetical protein JOF53_007833 [Crossiella equi]|uniref:DUF5313 domain-containing protein n=1 Tax=Crossiella equi TaxID=130796 RepID=A0ABS5AQX8_9PSEU|nr:DUF5313 family protein [Crossiella equi]MBP2478961.1 hypothetical protein [Crossiella equi]